MPSRSIPEQHRRPDVVRWHDHSGNRRQNSAWRGGKREVRRFGKVPCELADKPEEVVIHSAWSPDSIRLIVAGANNAGVSPVTRRHPLARGRVSNDTREIVLKR